MNMKELQDTLQKLIPALNKIGLRYHITGGLAVSYHGEPRLTQDIDIVLEANDAPKFALETYQQLSTEFYLEQVAVFEAFKNQKMFQILDETTLVKTDLHVGENIPNELSRTCLIEILPGIKVPMVSHEDAIISKLIWVKNGSQKSWQDLSMLLSRTNILNLELIQKLVLELNLTAEWNTAQTKTKS